jgi:type IV pilus assembly protein PilC
MPEYVYEAINESGNTIKGVLEADSVEAVTTSLLARGHIPVDITEKKGIASANLLEQLQDRLTLIKAHEVLLFTKQFRTLLRAGVPILTIFQALENQTENQALKKMIVTITQDVREGASLYDAFRKHPKAFSSLYCSMIRAGEASGDLPSIMDRLIFLVEHEDQIRSSVKSALRYPLIVAIFLVVAFFVLLTFVVPKFVSVLERANLELPLPTLICLKMYELLSNFWYIFLILIVAIAVGLNLYLRTERGRLVRDTLVMRLPLFGPLFIKAAMSRFASIFSILQSSGVAVLECMKILTGTIDNAAIAQEFSHISDRLEEGRGIAGPLKSSKYFTPIVINMVAIGEESGNLEEMLDEVSSHYDAEMDYAIKKLSEAIGPILTLSLAGVVLFFALAIYLPMWDLSQMVQ